MQRNEPASRGKDFAEFLVADSVEIPSSVSAAVLGTISDQLNPSSLKVFAKISLLQLMGGLFTLLFCPQFGISLTSSTGFMAYMMKYGESVCMLGCGALFTGFNLLVAGLILKPEEVRVLKKHRILQLTTVATLSLGAFICLGGETVFALGFVWLLGAIAGGAVTLEAGWTIKKNYVRRVWS